jgi:hypothetical protein
MDMNACACLGRDEVVAVDEVWKFGGQLVAALGGVSILVFGLSNYFGKLFADRFIETKKAELSAENERLKGELSREIETHRIRLKKSETFFQMELDATSKFVALRRGMMPRHHTPQMDWYDACDDIALQFESLKNQLSDFIATYGAVLSDEAVDLVSDCIGIAGSNKFDVSIDKVSATANSAASDLYDKAAKAEQRMLSELRSQIEK